MSNNATLDGLYGFWPETNPKDVYCLGGVTAQCLDKRVFSKVITWKEKKKKEKKNKKDWHSAQ